MLHYQPKIHLATREVSGVEALVRWRHPTLGLLPPGGFIPEAERLEMIGPLTRWVLDETLRQQKAWDDEGLDLTVAVNIAAGSLHEGSDLPASVGELLAKWNAEPDRLILELTEGALIETGAPDALDALHAMGVRLSSTISAPDTRRCPIFSAFRSTSSRSTGPSSQTSTRAATRR